MLRTEPNSPENTFDLLNASQLSTHFQSKNFCNQFNNGIKLTATNFDTWLKYSTACVVEVYSTVNSIIIEKFRS